MHFFITFPISSGFSFYQTNRDLVSIKNLINPLASVSKKSLVKVVKTNTAIATMSSLYFKVILQSSWTMLRIYRANYMNFQYFYSGYWFYVVAVKRFSLEFSLRVLANLGWEGKMIYLMAKASRYHKAEIFLLSKKCDLHRIQASISSISSGENCSLTSLRQSLNMGNSISPNLEAIKSAVTPNNWYFFSGTSFFYANSSINLMVKQRVSSLRVYFLWTAMIQSIKTVRFSRVIQLFIKRELVAVHQLRKSLCQMQLWPLIEVISQSRDYISRLTFYGPLRMCGQDTVVRAYFMISSKYSISGRDGFNPKFITQGLFWDLDLSASFSYTMWSLRVFLMQRPNYL